jgi:hypothetical protein
MGKSKHGIIGSQTASEGPIDNMLYNAGPRLLVVFCALCQLFALAVATGV